MQTEASTLPVVQLNAHKKSDRISKCNSKNSTLESKKLSSCGNTLFTSNKKCLKPLLGGPYKSSIKQQSLSDESKSSNKSFLGQRVMSAKILRFKQLQNQLADAHYHLNELANENRLLKALQKRQDSALRRYEGTNAELPRLINSHHEELRILQTKYKKLKELHKDTCNLLKEKENELYTVNSQNKHLLQLSKDRNLGEREKLQLQVSDLNHEIQQQQETIQLLHRKLALETKSLKHQLHVEIFKHKETQKNLQETIEKLKTLECLLDNREKRLYYNGQLPIYNKEKNLGSHSSTNLSDISASNGVKVLGRNKRSENGTPKDNLPLLDTLESNDDEKVSKTYNVNHSRNQLKSETMASLHQIRKFRLQKTPHMHKHAHSMSDLRSRFKDPEIEVLDNEKVTMYQDAAVDFQSMPKRNSCSNDKNESSRLRKLFNRMKSQTSQNLQKEIELESDYSSDNAESDNANEHNIEYYSTDSAQKSRELHARLINGTDDTYGTSDTLDGIMERIDNHYSDNEEEKELSICLVKNLAFQKRKYKSKSDISQHHKPKEFDDSDSEVDSKEKIDGNENYSPREYKANLSKYGKKQFSKFSNSTTHLEYMASEIKEPSESKNAELQMIPSDALDDTYTTNVKIRAQTSEETSEKQFSEINDVDNSFTDIRKEEYKKEKEEKYTEKKPIYTDVSHDNVYHNIFKLNNAYEEIKSLSSPERETQNSLQQMHEEYKTRIISSTEAEYVKTEDSKTMSDEDKDTLNHSEEDSMHNLVKEYRRLQVGETSNMRNHNDEEETLKTNDLNVETKNRLNATLEAENVNASSDNVYMPHQTEQASNLRTEAMEAKQTTDTKKKIINYNKEKLLATMKAIDDNENIEFLNQGFKNHNMVSRMQITQNLYRGIPTHSKPKQDVIKDIFEDNHIENKVRGTCSKSH
ncbi:myosin-11 isoform X2 [Odontomachus brunneus]|uniref:myosin-11 isoform X2 n=1 Tax=Odontomachus brunneus TaxID=486640 RepID=UPI0013F2B102|nr:myosin-11 isoform X2 [Odontomachus brunneus]